MSDSYLCRCTRSRSGDERLLRKLRHRNWKKVSISPFINFIRHYKLYNPCKSLREVVRESRMIWRKMSRTCKQPYIDQSKKACRMGYED